MGRCGGRAARDKVDPDSEVEQLARHGVRALTWHDDEYPKRLREIFDRPLAGFQLTQAKLADMSLELGKGMLLALHLGALKDAGTLEPVQVSLGKLNNVREAIGIARECRTLLGAAGITLEYPVMRHANNLESVLTYEGTSEVHQLVIGQALTGQAAFR